MFMRRSFELLTFFAYWFVLVPFLYNYLNKSKYLEFDMNDIWGSLKIYSLYLVGAIVIFMMVHRLGLWTYYFLKLSDKKLQLNLKQIDKTAEDKNTQSRKPSILEKGLQMERNMISVKKQLDEVDGKLKSLRKDSSHTIQIDIESQLPQEKNNTKLLGLLKSNKQSNTNVQNPHDFVSPVTLSSLNSPSMPRVYHSARKAPDVPSFVKAKSQSEIRGVPTIISLSSATLNGSVDTKALLRPSELKKAYTNPDLISDLPKWV